MYICIYTYINTYICIYIYIYILLCIYVYIHILIHIYIYIYVAIQPQIRCFPRCDLNIVHEHTRLRTRRTAREQRSRSIHEHETVATQSQTSQTFHEPFTDRVHVLPDTV